MNLIIMKRDTTRLVAIGTSIHIGDILAASDYI